MTSIPASAELHLPLCDSDRAYIAREYLTLDELCRDRGETAGDLRALIAARRLPAASYHLDGEERVPPDFLALMDEAGGIDRMAACFRDRFVAAAGDASAAAQAWEDYLDGAYGVCLRRVSPENIAGKAQRMAEVSAALEQPAPGEDAWCARLRDAVARLDALLRPFAACDRIRFGATSRDRLVTLPRERYPHAFR